MTFNNKNYQKRDKEFRAGSKPLNNAQLEAGRIIAWASSKNKSTTNYWIELNKSQGKTPYKRIIQFLRIYLIRYDFPRKLCLKLSDEEIIERWHWLIKTNGIKPGDCIINFIEKDIESGGKLIQNLSVLANENLRIKSPSTTSYFDYKTQKLESKYGKLPNKEIYIPPQQNHVERKRFRLY